MGVVHAGHHLALDTPIAIKLLQPADADDPSARSRFLREARRAASIQGEHCIRIFDVGEENGQPHIVMEKLVGETAFERLKRQGPFSVVDATTVMIQLLDAVGEAHGRGLVHRDLKPANIFLVQKPGERIWVKVLDFGIAKAMARTTTEGSTTMTELTEAGAMIGSPTYMSPEQMRGDPVDARSDLWSCGVVLYELLTGRKPFVGGTLVDLATKVVGAEPAPIGSNVPAPIARMIERCLRKHPAARPRNAYELAEGLAPFATPEARALLPRIRAWSKAEIAPPSATAKRSSFAGGVALVVGAGVCAFVVASVRSRHVAPVTAGSAVGALDPPVVAAPSVSAAVGVPAPSGCVVRVVASASASAPRPAPAPTSSSGRIRTTKDIELLQ